MNNSLNKINSKKLLIEELLGKTKLKLKFMKSKSKLLLKDYN